MLHAQQSNETENKLINNNSSRIDNGMSADTNEKRGLSIWRDWKRMQHSLMNFPFLTYLPTHSTIFRVRFLCGEFHVSMGSKGAHFYAFSLEIVFGMLESVGKNCRRLVRRAQWTIVHRKNTKRQDNNRSRTQFPARSDKIRRIKHYGLWKYWNEQLGRCNQSRKHFSKWSLGMFIIEWWKFQVGKCTFWCWK